jgi:hypothetical protein
LETQAELKLERVASLERDATVLVPYLASSSAIDNHSPDRRFHPAD